LTSEGLHVAVLNKFLAKIWDVLILILAYF
jgi:hypothetical protein